MAVDEAQGLSMVPYPGTHTCIYHWGDSDKHCFRMDRSMGVSSLCRVDYNCIHHLLLGQFGEEG
eukprot:scaffold4964_cov166-Amphora_coffeaeformis.AAC.3